MPSTSPSNRSYVSLIARRHSTKPGSRRSCTLPIAAVMSLPMSRRPTSWMLSSHQRWATLDAVVKALRSSTPW